MNKKLTRDDLNVLSGTDDFVQEALRLRDRRLAKIFKKGQGVYDREGHYLGEIVEVMCGSILYKNGKLRAQIDHIHADLG